MAYISYDRTSAVHTASIPHRKIAWGRLAALAMTLGLWAGIITTARVIF